MVSLVLALTQINQVRNYFPTKKMFYNQTFFSSNMFFIRLFVLAITWKKKSGVNVLVSSQTAVKGEHGFETVIRINNLRGGDWGEIQNSAHRVRSMRSRSSLFAVVFMCLISPTQKFILEKSTIHTKK